MADHDYSIEDAFMDECGHEVIMHMCVFCGATFDRFDDKRLPEYHSTFTTGSLSKTRYLDHTFSDTRKA